MTEEPEPLPFDHSKLSPRELEVLHTFLSTDEFATLPPDGEESAALPAPQPVDPTLDLEDEMLSVFATEVEEDLSVLRDGLEQAERDEVVDSAGFLTLRQVAHKIRGSAAMIGCDAMSTIAHRIELVVLQIKAGGISVHTGLYGLGHAVGALEVTLAGVVTQKHEDLQPLLSLEQDFETLGISLVEPDEEQMSLLYSKDDPRNRPDSVSIDRQQFDQLIQHTGRLIEQQTGLEHARKQVEEAFQELQAAQARLRRIEAFFSSVFMPVTNGGSDRTDEGVRPSSSLVARILREAAQRTGRAYQFQTVTPSLSLEEATRWDELELDRFSETNLLAYALNEAIGDITTATTQLQHALAQLDTLMSQHISITHQVRAGFIQHFPQATRLVQGLLVRAWEQQVLIPFAQVLRIDYQRQEDYAHFYTLNALLGFPPASEAPASSASPAQSLIQPVLRLDMDTQPETQVGVQVDEVIGQVELIVKPSPAPLQRPGISGMAIDSVGNVLLVLDMPELIWQDLWHREQTGDTELHDAPVRTKHTLPKILIVDDSVSIRRTLRQTLSQKDYIILEASDGREALEKIEEESPDLLLLDLEMPRMNGYDVLNVLRTRSLLPDLKIVLLTSRVSKKHKQRARELGAHRYLTKPCADNILLETVAALLGQ